MADRSEHAVAFDRTVELLHAAAAANAHTLLVGRRTPAGAAAAQRLEHTLDWLSLIHATGLFENLPTSALFATAIGNERALAHESEPGAAQADHHARAQSLVDAARRGVRLRLLPQFDVQLRRGVYIEPLRPAVEQSLWHRRQPYMHWRNGIVVALAESEVNRLRAEGDTVDVLFLDTDELYDLAARDDAPALRAELDRRLAIARAAPDRLGDCRGRHRLRGLLRQSTLLRALRDRLAGDHPAAHAALLPSVAQNRTLLEVQLTLPPRDPTVVADPQAAALAYQHSLQALVRRYAAAPDDSRGWRGRFRAVAAAMPQPAR